MTDLQWNFQWIVGLLILLNFLVGWAIKQLYEMTTVLKAIDLYLRTVDLSDGDH
jgi:hypothetical protein